MDPGERAGTLLNRVVRSRGIRLGVVVDVFLDGAATRVIGLDVLCGDGAHRFLPLAACDVAEGRVEVESALVLGDAAFYRERGRALSGVRGGLVTRDGRPVGRLRDVVVAEDGAVLALVAEIERGEELVARADTGAFVADRLDRAV